MKKLIVILALLSAAILCTGQKINKAEYFIDTDPGFGKATNIPVSVPANDVSLSYSVNISALSQGFHMMVLRARDDKGYWSQVEAYIGYHSDAQFSHGICPECAKNFYPEFDLYGADDQ